jgi:hypothetical protein
VLQVSIASGWLASAKRWCVRVDVAVCLEGVRTLVRKGLLNDLSELCKIQVSVGNLVLEPLERLSPCLRWSFPVFKELFSSEITIKGIGKDEYLNNAYLANPQRTGIDFFEGIYIIIF